MLLVGRMGAITNETTRTMIEMKMSVQLSNPSPSTAALPAIMPMAILEKASAAFPPTLMREAVLISLFRSNTLTSP
jgi:hypothetical protein